jgi:hypothetical protein
MSKSLSNSADAEDRLFPMVGRGPKGGSKCSRGHPSRCRSRIVPTRTGRVPTLAQPPPSRSDISVDPSRGRGVMQSGAHSIVSDDLTQVFHTSMARARSASCTREGPGQTGPTSGCRHWSSTSPPSTSSPSVPGPQLAWQIRAATHWDATRDILGCGCLRQLHNHPGGSPITGPLSTTSVVSTASRRSGADVEPRRDRDHLRARWLRKPSLAGHPWRGAMVPDSR